MTNYCNHLVFGDANLICMCSKNVRCPLNRDSKEPDELCYDIPIISYHNEEEARRIALCLDRGGKYLQPKYLRVIDMMYWYNDWDEGSSHLRELLQVLNEEYM